MLHSPTGAEPLVLAHSMAVVIDRAWKALLALHLPSSPAEMQPAACPDRELGHADGCAFGADKAETPLEPPRQQNCECILLAQLAEPPRRGQRVPVFLPGASGKPELARAGSLSHGPSAGLWWLSGVQTPVAAMPESAGLWLREHAREPPLGVRVQRESHGAL